jgi:hypothetical protein
MNQKQLGGALVVLAGVLASTTAFGVQTEIDLTVPGDTSLHTVTADFGGDGLVQNFTSHPAGTGVFDPFLTLERNATGGKPVGIESAYNTDGFSALYLDQQRPQWNNLLKLKDLAVVNGYYTFELDANEPGNDKSLLSIDNIRIYTSAGDNTGSVKSVEANLDLLGSLRWAMNNPLKGASLYNVDEWIKLDSSLSDQLKKANGGSGWSDMLLYVPVSAFAGANQNDYVWFYNLNGVHYSADYTPSDVNLGAEAGYEEWRSVTTVPDGGTTVALLGMALLGVAGLRSKFGKV